MNGNLIQTLLNLSLDNLETMFVKPLSSELIQKQKELIAQVLVLATEFNIDTQEYEHRFKTILSDYQSVNLNYTLGK